MNMIILNTKFEMQLNQIKYIGSLIMIKIKHETKKISFLEMKDTNTS